MLAQSIFTLQISVLLFLSFPLLRYGSNLWAFRSLNAAIMLQRPSFHFKQCAEGGQENPRGVTCKLQVH